MLILSQNKSIIVNLENIKQVRIEFIEKYPIYESDNNTLEQRKYCIYCNNDIFIGTYISEERAKEVLQEIIKCYSSYLQLNGGPAILQGQMDIQPNIFNIPKVYEMPKE